ncbi:MAG: hypothetical protein JWM28_64, partial [Chitinophagaceae bacterium]|nr:hypothetical protein [Chitinophagaceae bacterium]
YNKSGNIPLIYFKNERTSFKLDANPGISYAIAKKLQLEIGFNQLLGIGYYHEKGHNGNNYDTPYKTNSFNITTGFNNSYFSSLYFGFRVLLGS